MSPIDIRRGAVLIAVCLAAASAQATPQAVAPVTPAHPGGGVDGPYFPRERVAPVASSTGALLKQQAQQRLEARLGAHSALSNGAAITKAQAQQNGLGYIARHFDEIDTAHTGRVSLSDVRQYLQQKQQHQ
jgi:hypothetical protein